MRRQPAPAWILIFCAAAVAQELSAPREIIVKARVDGPSDLIITRTNLWWVNGINAKPGRHMQRNEPTYVNDAAWYPAWQTPEDPRGVDTSDSFPIELVTLSVEVELLAVGDAPDGTTIEPRSPIAVTYGEDRVIVTIPDPEPDSRWYVLAITET